MVNKTLSAMGIALALLSGQSLAGTEDWEGRFRVQLGQNKVDAYHSAHNVRFMFFSAGRCIKLSKGTKLNGYEMPKDFNICTNTNIPQFVQELQNVGAIISKDIIPGDSYHD